MIQSEVQLRIVDFPLTFNPGCRAAAGRLIAAFD